MKKPIAAAAAALFPLMGWSALTLTTIGSGLARPITLAFAPGDTSRYFVVEQRTGTTGRIRVVKGTTVLSTPFLSVAGVTTGSEQGLLGLAFHPNYPATPYFYVNLTNSSGQTEIRRGEVSTNPDLALTATTLVLRIPQPYTNHNGGTLEFGPDGYLYIGMGDGGSGNDPENRAQDKTSLHGKFLRIDVNGDDFPVDPDKNYRLPSGNMAGALPETWSYGWRNPWQWSFDQQAWNGFGGMFVADVGQGSYEEVDYEKPGAPSGLNYGWRVREGLHDTGLGGGTGPFVDPIAEYDHSGGCSISGGVLYRGVRLGPEMYGRYFFSDFCTPTLWSVPITFDSNGSATAGTRTSHTTLAGNVSAIRADATGELYAMRTSSSFQKITDDGKAVAGRVIFTGAPQKARRATMILRETAASAKEYAFDLRILPDGSYRIPAWAQSYTLSIKVAPWLRKRISVDASSGDVSAADLVLTSGDVDGDNVVSIFDYAALSDSFDLVKGDPGFNPLADLDEDEVISVFDYILLSDSFDQSGDPA